MSDTYAGTAQYHGEITTITDDDEPTGATFSTPLEQLQDEIAALKYLEVEVKAYATPGDYTWTRPDFARVVEVICVGHGGDGGAGAGSAGGGGGGSGAVKVRRFVLAADDGYSGINLTSAAIHVPAGGSNQVCSFTGASAGVYIASSPGADGAAGAGGVGGAGGAAGGTDGAAGAAGGNTGAGSSAGGDGYTRPGGLARSAGQVGLGGGGYGGGGGGGADSGAGGSGAGGFGGVFNGSVAGANGSGAAGGAGADGACFVISYLRAPLPEDV